MDQYPGHRPRISRHDVVAQLNSVVAPLKVACYAGRHLRDADLDRELIHLEEQLVPQVGRVERSQRGLDPRTDRITTVRDVLRAEDGRATGFGPGAGVSGDRLGLTVGIQADVVVHGMWKDPHTARSE